MNLPEDYTEEIFKAALLLIVEGKQPNDDPHILVASSAYLARALPIDAWESRKALDETPEGR